MTNAKFSKRCASAVIHADDRDNILRIGEDRARWTILTPEFVASFDLATDHTDPQVEALHRMVEQAGVSSTREGFFHPEAGIKARTC